MKTQLQQIRETLDAVRYPVDPRHEAAFKALLLNDKRRRRRGVIWFALLGMSVIVGGYALSQVIGNNQNQGMQQLEESLPLEGHENNIKVKQENNGITQSHSLSMTQELQSSDVNDSEDKTITDAHLNTAAETSQNSERTIASSVSKSDVSITAAYAQTKMQTASHLLQATSKNSASNAVQGMQSTAETPASITEDKTMMLAQITTGDASDTELNSVVSQRMPFAIAMLPTTATDQLFSTREITQRPTIIPALRILDAHRLHYGLTVSAFPVGKLLSNTSQDIGYGYHLGGYASYQVNGRMYLRADAGFSKADRGFTYTKKSITEQYGFTLIEEHHTLDVKQLYSVYASTEAELRSGKSLFCLGLQGQYIYGARGDIEDIQYSQEAGNPVISTSNNIWLKTEAMPKLSVQALFGIRSRLTRRLELGALVYIPVVHTIRAPHDDQQYSYKVSSHGLLPQFSLSYQINSR